MQILVHQVFFNDEIVNDEILTARRVFAHIELQQVVDRVGAFEHDSVQPHAVANELFELLPIDLSEAFEPGYLPLRAQLLGRLVSLLLGIAVEGLLLVAHSEERGLKYEQVPVLDDLREELEEERYHEQPDVHAVDIGIRGNDDFVISEAVDAVFNVEGALEEEELLVLVYGVPPQAEGVEGLAAEAEDGLCVGVAALGYGAGRGVALGDEDGRLFAPGVAGVGEVDGAVAELAVVEVGLLGLLAGLFLDS